MFDDDDEDGGLVVFTLPLSAAFSLRIHSQKTPTFSFLFSPPPEMEDDFLKSNTDCVYFLASPLTCKKGVDCEYRHSEIARLNPRECWFWVSGGCLNPTCAFRHPPLDGRPETASVSTTSHHQPAVPANKTNARCYFYFNGHCNKGDRCFYLHGSEETMPNQVSSKTATAAYDSEKKTSMCSDMGSAPVETQSFGIISERVAGTKIKTEKVLCQYPGYNVAEQSVSPMVSSPRGEITANRSNSPVPEAFMRSLVSTVESSDDHDLDPIEREEWLESSPGFDVLVNNASEDFIYEDDAGYLLHHDMEDCENYDQPLGYDYEDKSKYDPAYPDLRISFGRGHDRFQYTDDEDIRNSITKLPFYEKERALDCTFQQKRKHFETDLGYKCRSGVDLREFLKKRRVIDGQYPTCSQIRERPPMLPKRHLQGRLASKIEVHSVGSRTHLNGGAHKPARYRHSRVGWSRHHFKERRQGKQQNHSSEFLGKKSSRKQRSTEESALFTGPKTLAQIKEEKRKAQENGHCAAA